MGRLLRPKPLSWDETSEAGAWSVGRLYSHGHNITTCHMITRHLLGGRVNSLVAEGLSGLTGARSLCLIEVLRLLKNSSFCSPPTAATAGAGRGLPTGTRALGGGGLEKSSGNKDKNIDQLLTTSVNI